MRYCVIDVGSNSVRLMLSENGKTIYKKVKITRLAENLGEGRYLSKMAIDRTVSAVEEFYCEAKLENPNEIYIFATAAVRLSVNGKIFTDLVKEKTGLCVDVVSGEVEAMLGVKGALSGKKGGLIDIGGASTEVAIITEKENSFNSFPIGAGTLTDAMTKEDFFCVLNGIFYNLKVDNVSNFYAIGGTATSAVAMICELKTYDRNVVHGYNLSKKQLDELCDKLSKMSLEQIENLIGLQKGREKVIYAGLLIMRYLMHRLNLAYVTVSENDNLEGYLQYIKEKNE